MAHKMVEDLWGSDDDASDGADDTSLLHHDDAQRHAGDNAPSRKRAGVADVPPARRHIPSFQGAFSQARMVDNSGYSDGLKRQRLDTVMSGFSGASAADLNISLNSSALAANIDLSSLPALPDQLSTNYGELPDAAKLFAALNGSSTVDGEAGEADAETQARLSALIAQSGGWSALQANHDNDHAAQAIDDTSSFTPEQHSVEEESIPRTRQSSVTRRDLNGLFLPPRPKQLPRDERYHSNGTNIINNQSPVLSPFASQCATPTESNHPTSIPKRANGSKSKSRNKNVSIVAPGDSDMSPTFNEVVMMNGNEVSTTIAKLSRRGSSINSKMKKLPPRSKMDLTPSYFKMRALSASIIAIQKSSDGLLDVDGVRLLKEAAKAREHWELEVKRANEPVAAQTLQVDANRHVTLLKRMKDSLTEELVKLQIEESVLRHVRGIAKDRMEQLTSVA